MAVTVAASLLHKITIMETSSQPKLYPSNSTLVFIIVLIIMGSTHIISAQDESIQSNKSNIYLGFGASFGVRSNKVISENFEAINNMAVLQEGGSGIIITGTRFARVKFETGFYYSNSSVVHTTDLVELSSSLNLYPLQFFSKGKRCVEPYLTTGVSKNKHKFHGFYHLEEAGTTAINYSVTLEPYIGKAVTSITTLGAGLEIHFRDDHSFVHMFLEAKYGKFNGSKNTTLLDKTTFTDQLLVSMGITFGRHY
jgi:hypothetical protein